MDRKDGMNYAPKGKPAPVVEPGAFSIAAIALDHGHIYGMCNGLVEAGARVKWVYDRDPQKVEMIGIKTLEQLCELLDMQPGNIIKYVENKP